MNALPSLLLSVLLCVPAVGAERLKSLKLTDGTELLDVEVKEITAEGARVTHKHGGGMIPPAKLPPALKKIQEEKATAKSKEDEARAIQAVEKRQEMAAAQRRLNPMLMRCPIVQPCHTKGPMAGPGFRYRMAFANQSGKAMKGKLRFSAVTVEGSMVGNDSINCDLKDGEEDFPILEIFTGPPIRYGNAPGVGISGIFWTFIPDGGGPEVTGRCSVPNVISDP